MSTVRTIAVHRPEQFPVGEHRPKPTALTANLTEAGASLWLGEKIDTGIWECTPGEFTAERIGYTEICLILEGTVTLDVAGETSEKFGPGDIMVMPSGWVGKWTVHTPLRKHYTIVHDS